MVEKNNAQELVVVSADEFDAARRQNGFFIGPFSDRTRDNRRQDYGVLVSGQFVYCEPAAVKRGQE